MEFEYHTDNINVTTINNNPVSSGGGATFNWLQANVGVDFATAPIATGARGIALGEAALVQAADSIAIGTDSSTSSTEGSVALGSAALVEGDNGLAIGNAAYAQSVTGISIGYLSWAEAVGGLAMGTSAYASGIDAVCVGSNTEALGQNSLALANQAQAQADDSMAIGDASVVLAAAVGASAFGPHTQAQFIAENASGSGRGATHVYNKTSVYHMRGVTVGPAPTNLGASSSSIVTTPSDHARIPANSAVLYEMRVVGRSPDNTDLASYVLRGLVVNTLGVPTAVGVQTVDIVHESAAGLDCVLLVNGTQDAIAPRVTGAVGTMHWYAEVRLTVVGDN